MKNQAFCFLRYIFCAILLIPIFTVLLKDNPWKSNGLFLLADLDELDKERDIHSSFDESNDSFFPSNPMELMNVIRSFESANDATSPSDAIDAAIEAFENQDQSDSPFNLGDR
tara:strand:- start:1771 stop:2109 length:339 start_codon:yes stop_codon:yes gene_type:complete